MTVSNAFQRATTISSIAAKRRCLLTTSPFKSKQRYFFDFQQQYRKQSSTTHMSISDTPMGKNQAGSKLLDGLDVYTVDALDDGHPLTVYGIDSEPAESFSSSVDSPLRPILLLHGRTWSSVPVYHLLGGPKEKELGKHKSRSLIEAFRDAGLQPYAMDFRGFGGTPPDLTGCVEPNKCVTDVESVLQWISERHALDETHKDDKYKLLHDQMPALLGWSQGALVAQLVAQKSPNLFSKLVLYGSIYDPHIRYPREPLYREASMHLNSTSSSDPLPKIINTLDDAMEDFTIEGSIPPEPARLFGEASLITDPIKANWKHLYQFNNCDPARICDVPTLVIAGDQDPYTTLQVQKELFTNLGRGSDRTWSIISDADHAVHLLDGRARFTKTVSDFVQNN